MTTKPRFLKPRTGVYTYLESRCRVTETFHDSSNRNGLREIRYEWIDPSGPKNGNYPAGTVVTRMVRGNALKGTFQVISETIVKP